ncbi:uncharacterized protein SCHCODRAFT_02082560 [Schizophyllum commune H4-8]|uniref:uncharacterized protein n=1 Tax=Schizophyllum commune (strain H4-8 / FGSC 9210) TaxID=578458 RepID=UPI002160621E|nr:uncharacterized protein SCHCODRAFT_02082560 [Schizophyllum commune H4-8]KAI5886842.1 hypothetical protein SCHCODRAFT_02082560 [Schizophyllum commune H4-8]
MLCESVRLVDSYKERARLQQLTFVSSLRCSIVYLHYLTRTFSCHYQSSLRFELLVLQRNRGFTPGTSKYPSFAWPSVGFLNAPARRNEQQGECTTVCRAHSDHHQRPIPTTRWSVVALCVAERRSAPDDSRAERRHPSCESFQCVTTRVTDFSCFPPPCLRRRRLTIGRPIGGYAIPDSSMTRLHRRLGSPTITRGSRAHRGSGGAIGRSLDGPHLHPAARRYPEPSRDLIRFSGSSSYP